MTQNTQKIEQLAHTLLRDRSPEEVRQRLEPDTTTPYARLANIKGSDPDSTRNRWQGLIGPDKTIPSALYDGEDMEVYSANIEN